MMFLGLSRLNRLGKRGPPLSINADLMALADSLNQDGTAGAEGRPNISRIQFERTFIGIWILSYVTERQIKF